MFAFGFASTELATQYLKVYWINILQHSVRLLRHVSKQFKGKFSSNRLMHSLMLKIVKYVYTCIVLWNNKSELYVVNKYI